MAGGDEKPEATLDPLLMKGMTGQLPVTEAPPLVVSSGIGQQTAASTDGDLEKLNVLPGVIAGAQDQAQLTQAVGDLAAKA